MSDRGERRDRRDRGDRRKNNDKDGGRGGGGGGEGRKRNKDGGGGDRRNRRRGDRKGDDQNLPGGMEKRPTILAKPDRNVDFPTLQQSITNNKKPLSSTDEPLEGKPSESSPEKSRSGSPNSTKVMQREDSAGPVSQSAPALGEQLRTASPAANHMSGLSQTSKPQQGPTPHERATKFIDEAQQMSENILPFLTDNTDFLVVGVLGLQHSGKSTILNALSAREKMFRVQSFEKQMLGEHTTTGINAWVSPQRIIYLDCQPLNSPSILDRLIQTDKKNSTEFSTLENTVEIQSLQIAGFLMTICHALVVVQDWFVDAGLLRTLQTAEMLKPSSPAFISAEDDAAIIEYFPEVFFVHNKAKLEDFSGDNVKSMQALYENAFAKSQLKISGRMGLSSGLILPHLNPDSCDKSSLNLHLLPDTDMDNDETEFQSMISFDDLAVKMRRNILSTSKTPLTSSNKLTERGWFGFAQKSWDNIKNSSFYVEYSRLM